MQKFSGSSHGDLPLLTRPCQSRHPSLLAGIGDVIPQRRHCPLCSQQHEIEADSRIDVDVYLLPDAHSCNCRLGDRLRSGRDSE
jgi:hypothetical protein